MKRTHGEKSLSPSAPGDWTRKRLGALGASALALAAGTAHALNPCKYRKLSWLTATASVAAALLAPHGAMAQAGPVTQYFELDGNRTDNAADARDDWSTVNAGGGSVSIIRRVFVADPEPLTVFSTGGSKDDLDISSWRHKSGSTPPKDAITNAYAAAYNIAGDLVIYAGAERGATNGDAFSGFWFFKSNVSVGDNGRFNGLHTVGDVLVLANYENGGSKVTIQVFEWNPAQATHNGVLKLLAGDLNSSALCGSSVSPAYCGITNPDSSELPVDSFFEVGINISAVLRQANSTNSPCFSAFLHETRSSSSISATLKDFASGAFDVCGVRISKQCPAGQIGANGNSIDYSFKGQVSNVGFGGLSNFVFTDYPQQPASGPLPTVGAITLYACNASGEANTNLPPITALAAGAQGCYLGGFNTTINGSTNRIKVVASTGGTGTTEYTTTEAEQATCPILTFPVGITVDKACTASLTPINNQLVVKVDFNGNVCNTGNTQLTNVMVVDEVVGMNPVTVLTNQVLGAAGSASACLPYSGSYFPSAANAGTTTTFSDMARARGTPPGITQAPVQTAVSTGATCGLCPAGVCTTSSGATVEQLLRQQRTKK